MSCETTTDRETREEADRRFSKVREYWRKPPEHAAFYLLHHLWTRAATHDPDYSKQEWKALEGAIMKLGARPDAG